MSVIGERLREQEKNNNDSFNTYTEINLDLKLTSMLLYTMAFANFLDYAICFLKNLINNF